VALAENNPDRGLIVSVTELIIDGEEVEIHLAGELGLEVFHLEFKNDEAAQPQVIEEQAHVVVLSTDFQRILAPYKREPLA
jgi:hypothetical protein